MVVVLTRSRISNFVQNKNFRFGTLSEFSSNSSKILLYDTEVSVQNLTNGSRLKSVESFRTYGLVNIHLFIFIPTTRNAENIKLRAYVQNSFYLHYSKTLIILYHLIIL